MKKIAVSPDGACRGNAGLGGWGVLMRYGHHEKQLYGAEANTTNNRMELMAAIKAIEAVKESCEIELWTDSQYVKKGITEWLPNWKARDWKTANRKPVKNVDLWQQLEAAIQTHHVSWHWVRGHSGHPENERVDALANLAMDEYGHGQ